MADGTRWAVRALFGALTVSAVGLPAHATALLVPAYFSPADDPGDWSQLTAAAGRVSVTAIFNPNSGPGTAADPAFTSALAAFRAAGGSAIAYVHTQKSNGTLRPLVDVEAEIATYRSFYTFDGVFVDEMTDDTKTADISFYTNLYAYIKGLNPTYKVVGNPGTNVPKAYSAVADILVTFEDTGGKYATNVPDSWTSTQPATNFAHIVYEVPDAASLAATLRQATEQNVANVFVTDDGADGNPYDSLPSYWQAEVNAIVPEPAAGLILSAVGLVPLMRKRQSDLTKQVIS